MDGIRFKKNLALTCLIWIFLVTASFFWNYTSAKKSQEQLAFQTARSFFDLIVMTREWNARHGGVYVPISDRTRPNPYLQGDMRDIRVNADLLLTKINPAFMTRQISEIAERQDISFHITSRNPIRPQNKPTRREAAALAAFENGAPEKGNFIKNNGEKAFFYMAPLKTKQTCLKCHAEQGYELGDIRGGIRVTLPFTPSIPMAALLFGHLGIAVVGLAGIIFTGRRLHVAYGTIRNQAVFDALTGIPNRRHFSERILTEYDRSRRDNEPLAIILCDIDNFKAFNDTYGHDRGDSCLRIVAQRIKSTLKRPGDFCARYGGEEFIVVLPNTPLAGATRVAENIRKKIEDADIPHEKGSYAGIVTVSLGVATSTGEASISHEKLIQYADLALYTAKEKGRNRVVSFDEV